MTLDVANRIILLDADNHPHHFSLVAYYLPQNFESTTLMVTVNRANRTIQLCPTQWLQSRSSVYLIKMAQIE